MKCYFTILKNQENLPALLQFQELSKSVLIIENERFLLFLYHTFGETIIMLVSSSGSTAYFCSTLRLYRQAVYYFVEKVGESQYFNTT